MPFGFGKSRIPYDMFDIERSADEAKRFTRCANIYHRGQEVAWDGKDILPMLLAKHGGIKVDPEKKQALERIFAIIMWGELAAWRIAAQLADRLVPLEAKMAATSQAHDEARHFYVMHDYLTELGYVPKRMDRAPQALLDVVLGTDHLAYKLVGMQLLIEPMALTIFQLCREADVEPVLTELMRYYERDEARHVGLGMQYLPSLMKGWSRRQASAMATFQVRLMFWALWEQKLLEPDFAVLGVDPRSTIERARRKQLSVIQATCQAAGIRVGRDRNLAAMAMNAIIELAFPGADTEKSPRRRIEAAWRALWSKPELFDLGEIAVHHRHAIKTARGTISHGEDLDYPGQ